MDDTWKKYLIEFETKVLLPMFESGEYEIKTEPVPLRPGKLQDTPFGDFVGKEFNYNSFLSFNYYGLFKPSKEILNTKIGVSKTTVKAPVIHFSSVKIEHIEKYCKNLIIDFVLFKKFLVSLRWDK